MNSVPENHRTSDFEVEADSAPTTQETERGYCDVDDRTATAVIDSVKAPTQRSADRSWVGDQPTATTPHDPASGTASSVDSAQPVNLGKVYVVLPAYNEEAGLPELLHEIKKVFALSRRQYEVIVVDDASTDETAQVASQASFHMPLTLVQHETNQNLPGALRTGFLTALKMCQDQDVIVTMDGDNTHPPAIIDRLLQQISERYDVTIASRFQPGSRVVGVPWTRVITAFGARMMFKIMMPIPGVRDYTCGYRAYRANVLRKAVEYYGDEFVSEKGFSCMADVLLKMRRFKLVFGEVPMLLRYDQKEGGSKMAVVRTILQTLSLLIKRRFGGY